MERNSQNFSKSSSQSTRLPLFINPNYEDLQDHKNIFQSFVPIKNTLDDDPQQDQSGNQEDSHEQHESQEEDSNEDEPVVELEPGSDDDEDDADHGSQQEVTI